MGLKLIYKAIIWFGALELIKNANLNVDTKMAGFAMAVYIGFLLVDALSEK